MSISRPALVFLASAAFAGIPHHDTSAHGASRAMASHYTEVATVHEAVIRGDLPAARAAAAALARSDAAGMPEKTAQYREAVRTFAQRIVMADDVSAAAAGTASLLGTCGDCHRAAAVVPAPVLPARPAVGEAVGHMLDHQRGVDRLMQGLVIPSSTLWNEGAQMLRAAPLGAGKLPKDPKLTAEIASSEKRVHALADEAAGSSAPDARVAVYGQVIGTCAACHGLHGTIWGPSKH